MCRLARLPRPARGLAGLLFAAWQDNADSLTETRDSGDSRSERRDRGTKSRKDTATIAERRSGDIFQCRGAARDSRQLSVGVKRLLVPRYKRYYHERRSGSIFQCRSIFQLSVPRFNGRAPIKNPDDTCTALLVHSYIPYD